MKPESALAVGGPEGGIPTMSGIEHIGLSVPDLDQGIAFFVGVVGCEILYRHGPYVEDPGDPDNFFTKYVGLDPRTRVEIAMLRCRNGPNLELFEFEAPEQVRRVPRFSDWGGAHLTFYVDDMNAAVAHLRAHGVKAFAGAADSPGPEAGRDSTNTHWETPWGQQMEIITYPHGRDYENDTEQRLWQPNKPSTWITPP